MTEHQHSNEVHEDGHAHGRWAAYRHHVRKGMTAALLLTALTLCLHALHLPWVHRFDHFFTSLVVLQSHATSDDDERKDATAAQLPVQLIEISALARVQAFDHAHPDYRDVERLQGVRPLDRSATAQLLAALADRLEDSSRTEAPPTVLALDFDVSPLIGDAPAVTEATAQALDRLRQHLDLVLIALPRSEPAQVTAQRDFMRHQAKCATGPPPKGQHGLYFASAELLTRQGEGPLHFAATCQGSPCAAGPAIFPALGGLSHLLWQQAQGKTLSKDEQASLTHLCTQSEPAPSPALKDAWHLKLYNWPLLQTERLIFSPIQADPDALKQGVSNREHALQTTLDQIRKLELKAPLLMLAIDGGAGHDKFISPAALAAPVSGVSFHALQAMSLAEPLEQGGWSALWGALVDLLLGAVFVLAASWFAVLLEPVKPRWPHLWLLLGSILPLMIAALLLWLSLLAGARLMLYGGYWFNPVYVIAGLLIHCYVEGWAAALPEPAEPAAAAHPLDHKLARAGYRLCIAAGVIALIYQIAHG